VNLISWLKRSDVELLRDILNNNHFLLGNVVLFLRGSTHDKFKTSSQKPLAPGMNSVNLAGFVFNDGSQLFPVLLCRKRFSRKSQNKKSLYVTRTTTCSDALVWSENVLGFRLKFVQKTKCDKQQNLSITDM